MKTPGPLGLAVSLAALTLLALTACSANGTEGDAGTAGNRPRTDTSGRCEGVCDGSPPTLPLISASGGYGDVTTYGSVVDPSPSAGGACNYGATGILHFAAIQVSRLPGDLQGQWQGGRICGQCARVRVRTPEGWKSTVVRIVDKCPDGYCGIDLGGAPARELMGEKAGRYSGEWTFVSCEGHAGVSDGPPSLYVKEGSNAFWSLVQVRNPAERVLEMRLRPVGKGGSSGWVTLAWAKEAENFFKVPTEVLRDTGAYDLEVVLPGGAGYAAGLKGTALAVEGSSVPLAARP